MPLPIVGKTHVAAFLAWAARRLAEGAPEGIEGMARLLLVDDSPFATKVVQLFVEDAGHDVVGVASDGHTAVILYREHRPELVLLDLSMPGKSGQDCLREIMAEDPGARVLIVSAETGVPTVADCIRSGAKGYLAKPLKLHDEKFCAEFAEAIDRALTD